MSRTDFRSPFSLKGRRNEGLRGFSGKPSHPPLTDIPTAAYAFVAVFDVLSLVLHDGHAEVGRELYRAATWVLLGGAGVSVLTAVTGALDWARMRAGSDVRRAANAHAITMVTVTVLVLVDLVLRLTAGRDDDYSRPVIVVLSVVAGLLTVLGAAIGGSLVYEHGVRVETLTRDGDLR
jgi:uncharacterized membrane protein